MLNEINEASVGNTDKRIIEIPILVLANPFLFFFRYKGDTPLKLK